MYKKQIIAVVVPAYNEEILIVRTLKGIPGFIDKVIVVDDKSSDSTVNKVLACVKDDPRITLIQHEKIKA